MKSKELQAAIRDALAANVDECMRAIDFLRPSRGDTYSHREKSVTLQCAFSSCANPPYAPGVVVHIFPRLVIINTEVGEMALQLVEDPVLLANAPNVIQNQRLSMLVHPQKPELYVRDIDELPAVVSRLRGEVCKEGMSFLRDLSSAQGIVRAYTSDDTRPLRQKPWYVAVIASALLVGEIETAIQVLNQEFGSAGARKRYASLHRNIGRTIGSSVFLTRGTPLAGQEPRRGSESAEP